MRLLAAVLACSLAAIGLAWWAACYGTAKADWL